MISHKKFLRRFYLIEKKYYTNKRFDISKNYLHSLIINKVNFFPKFSYLRFFCNLILLILSYISIFLCKFKKISVANYFIVHKKSNGKYDFRSEYVLKNYNFKKSLNIVRCASFIDSLKSYFNYPNVIFFLSIDYFNNPFFYKKSSLRKNYIMLHEKEEKNYNQIKKIFYFLKIKKFISIDDHRVIQSFLRICNELNIYSFGYMHYKFSNYIVGIKYLCFDNFLVWSNYFKKKLFEVNRNYISKRIFISGFSKKNIAKKIEKSKINILFIIDLDLDFQITKNFLKNLNKVKRVNLYVKLRPQVAENIWEKLCIKEKIKFFKFENLDVINQLIKMDYFIGNISTAIIEAPLYGAIPLKIISKNDFADDLIRDKVVIKIKNFNDIVKIIKNKPLLKNVNELFKRVWGKKKYKTTNINNILNDFIELN
jgi:hypothetical protein